MPRYLRLTFVVYREYFVYDGTMTNIIIKLRYLPLQVLFYLKLSSEFENVLVKIRENSTFCTDQFKHDHG